MFSRSLSLPQMFLTNSRCLSLSLLSPIHAPHTQTGAHTCSPIWEGSVSPHNYGFSEFVHQRECCTLRRRTNIGRRSTRLPRDFRVWTTATSNSSSSAQPTSGAPRSDRKLRCCCCALTPILRRDSGANCCILPVQRLSQLTHAGRRSRSACESFEVACQLGEHSPQKFATMCLLFA